MGVINRTALGSPFVSRYARRIFPIKHHYMRCRQVDARFYQRLSSILRIVIPSIRSKEALLLVMHSSLLIFRTAISLYVAALDGKWVYFSCHTSVEV